MDDKIISSGPSQIGQQIVFLERLGLLKLSLYVIRMSEAVLNLLEVLKVL